MAADVFTRLLDRVVVNEKGCWVWAGCKLKGGYGHIRDGKKVVLVHRLAYELLRGPIPAGKEIDHLCRERACCNPEHLEAVVHQVNCQRGNLGTQTRGTHCGKGHPLSGDNLYVWPNGKGRQCVTCARRWRAERTKRERERRARG